MRNSILKSYLKKFIRSEAFISVIIVFVLAIGIIGTSYALYMDVDTDTDYQLVEVGDLSVGFDNGDSTFTLNYLTPTDDDIATNKVQSDISKEISKNNFFSFYIYNNGNYTANFDIKLVPQEGSISSEYLRYQICKDNIENCKDIKTLSEAENSIIFNDELSPNRTETQTNPSAYYFLRVWVSSEYGDKVSENDKVVLKVEIEAKNASGYLDNDNTLVGKLLSDDRVKINNTVPKFDGIADYVETGNKDSGELGLFKAADDYGISYYYRGAQSYNYVNFAGFTWRVVRINGDGSIRLILEGTLANVKQKGETNEVYKNSALIALDSDGFVKFNSLIEDNAYAGYMYGLIGATENVCVITNSEGEKSIDTTITTESACVSGEWMSGYDATHININDSTIKTYIDTFYEQYLLKYKDYIADTMFCGDKSLARLEINGGEIQLGYGQNETIYSFVDRGEIISDEILIMLPTLECAKNATNTYSRYTSKIDTKTTTNKGVEVNNDLTYPIALLSADEVVMAGQSPAATNNSYYLYIIPENDWLHSSWWTMTPYTGGFEATGFFISGDLLLTGSVESIPGVRPVINLKADVLYKTGDGTSETPYEIK